MDFRPLDATERSEPITVLRGHADSGRALLVDRKDTSFVGTAEEVPDEEVKLGADNLKQLVGALGD
jgi:hypothetical protein